MVEKNVSGNRGVKPHADLCHYVEQTAGFAVSTPKEFERMSEIIRSRTGDMLSPTTLKRIWGYLNERVNTRRSTLDILSRFCGWNNYEEFLNGYSPEAESGPLGSMTIRAGEDMKQGDRIRLMWAPARICVIEYCGNDRWRVVESGGTRLMPGDSFSAPLICAGEPLYLADLIHAGEKAGIYVCGRRSGINFVKE